MANKPDKHVAGEVDDNSTRNTVTQSDSMNGLSWDAPLRTARESALAPDDYNENEHNPPRSDFIIEADLQTEREDLLEEDSPTELAKRLESELTGSILALWQQRLTQSTSFEGEIEIEYAESDINSSGPPSPSSDDPSVLPHPDLVNHNFGNTDRNGNRATTKLPMPSSSEGTNATLEEMRSKLRKTKFDYNTDTKVRISEATPLLDYRSVLKKKGNV
uniref:Uncharacterized protein n=1 Tax=Biomphalaria glabrata TaxID=6526 RepID=A0A2C9K2E6_BIOGL